LLSLLVILNVSFLCTVQKQLSCKKNTDALDISLTRTSYPSDPSFLLSLCKTLSTFKTLLFRIYYASVAICKYRSTVTVKRGKNTLIVGDEALAMRSQLCHIDIFLLDYSILFH